MAYFKERPQWAEPCAVCGEQIGIHGAKGMCGKHYMRMKRYGDPHYLTPEEQRRANNRLAQLARVERVKETTYRKFHGRHEHRVVAEQKLGRELFPHEIVHHIDENKHNNHPDNLEIITQSEHTRRHRRSPRGHFTA